MASATPLGEEEFATLKELVDAGDRVGYYGQLEEWGYKYGELARGVVTGDQLSGRTANNFFLGRAEEQIEYYNSENGFEPGDPGYANPEISDEDMARLSQNLMEEDFEYRSADDSPNRIGEPLHVDDIQEYHANAFRDSFADRIPNEGIGIEAWTPHDALAQQEDADARDEMWRDMLDDPAWMTAISTRAHPFSDYGRDQEGAGFFGVFSTEGSVGPYRIDVPGAEDGGQVIAGTGVNQLGLGGDDGNYQYAERGTDGADTIYMFTGDDAVRAEGGDDRAYLGRGDDYAEMGPGNDVSFPGPGQDYTHGGPGIDFTDYSRGYGSLPSLEDMARFNQGTPTLTVPGLPIADFTPNVTYDVQNYRFDVDVTPDVIRVTEPSPTLSYLGMDFTRRTQDVASETEGYMGSSITDIVRLRGTENSLYLDGGEGDPDRFIADLPAEVASGATYDDTPGIVPTGQDFEGRPYDSRIQIDEDTTVYIVDFEDTEIGTIREGRIGEVFTDEAEVLPGNEAEGARDDIVPTPINETERSIDIPEAARLLERDLPVVRENLVNLSNTQGLTEEQSAYLETLRSPAPAIMLGALSDHGVNRLNINGEDLETAEGRVGAILDASVSALEDHQVPVPQAQIDAAYEEEADRVRPEFDYQIEPVALEYDEAGAGL